MNFRSILDKLTKNEFKEIFLTFKFFFDRTSEYKKQINNLQGQYKSLEIRKSQGVLKEDDFTFGENKIRVALIDIFSRILELTEEKGGSKSGGKAVQDTTQDLINLVQVEVENLGYEIIAQMHTDQSSYYFKAKKSSFIRKDFYVVQVLNLYKLNNPLSEYNQKYLDFFANCPPPFVNLIDFHPKTPSYITRKYIQGIVLRELIECGVKLSLSTALNSIITITKGLKKIDEEQIFYNDLTPDQIILDEERNTLLFPLNIYEDNIQVVTWKNLKDGIKFMSPEQLALAGDKVAQNQLTILSSQFSLGLFFYYVLTGEPLFDGKGLPNLYEDRMNTKETKRQLNDFYKLVQQQLLRYGMAKSVAADLLKEFKKVFKKITQTDPTKRYQRVQAFILKMESFKLRIEEEKGKTEGKYLFQVVDSFYQFIKTKENAIDLFYQSLESQLLAKKSMAKDDNRNFEFQYAMEYLFSSITNLETPANNVEALSCLVKNVHFDFTLEDYEIFFTILKGHIFQNGSVKSSLMEEAWDNFINAALDAIDTILSPLKPITPN